MVSNNILEYKAAINSLVETSSVFRDNSIEFSQYLNSDGIEVLEINLENKSNLGLILIYEDSHAHIEIHDKISADPIFIKSYSFENLVGLVTFLKESLLKKWK